MSRFKPMLADKADLRLVRFPMNASAKLDGVRCLAINGQPMSRSMKIIPNRSIQQWFAANAKLLEGMDGELIVGSPTHPDVYRTTTSGVMTEAFAPDFTYFVFDKFDVPGPYHQRVARLPQENLPARLRYLEHEVIHSLDELADFETRMLDLGYEGAMLRGPKSPYKHGRSTANEGFLLKVKRFEDAEAEVIGFDEEMANNNTARTSETGRTVRSSHQANKVGKGTLGAWVVKGVTAFPDVTFRIGTGMDDAMRASAWNHRDTLLGKIIKYTYFNIGVKDSPRHPVFKGFRDLIDL
jgi:DNA ligase-1